MPGADLVGRIVIDVVPGERIGDMRLRESVARYAERFDQMLLERGGDFSWSYLASPFDARYRLNDLELCVDVRNGMIYAVRAFSGGFGEVQIGMTADTAIGADSRVYFDEAEGALLMRGVDGILFELSETDPDLTSFGHLSIVSLSVFAPEAALT